MRKGVIEILRSVGVGVMPTDTLYGIVGSALKPDAVARIYKLRKRNLKKPMIVLISDMRQGTWDTFGIQLSKHERVILRKLWPNKLSVILPCRSKKFAYLHRGAKTLAFRHPKPKWLQNLLKKTGPLVAPSANWEGERPAKTIREAKRYFKNSVDFYLDRGRRAGKPSTLVEIKRGELRVLREGAVRVTPKRA